MCLFCLAVNFVLFSDVVYAEPELELKQGNGLARPGEPYEFVCEVSWPGLAQDYSIRTAELDPIDWGKVRVKEVRTFNRDGYNVVSQTIEIIANDVGEYENPSGLIKYISPEASVKAIAQDGTVPAEPEVSPTLRLTPFTLNVQKSSSLLWTGLCLGALPIIAIAVFLFLKLARKGALEPADTTHSGNIAEIKDVLHTARKHRLDGKYYEFYVELGRAAHLLSASELKSRLDGRSDAVGYRGEQPSEDHMDTDYREVERVLSQYDKE